MQNELNALSEDLKDLITILSNAPDTQIDHQIIPRLKRLINETPENIINEMTEILDKCAYASLASDFAMNAMHEARNIAVHLKAFKEMADNT